jgi:transcriptional regulator of met regulon
MNFLQDLYEKTTYSKDMTDAVPVELIKEIQKNIRDGASNSKLKWANALELTHKAYKVANVQRPFPSMKNAWKQYEENIQYAVQQLATHHGMKADWRMSSSVFMDSFQVDIFNGTEKKSVIVEALSMDDLSNKIGTKTFSAYNIEQNEEDGKVTIQPRKFGIKQPFRVVINELLDAPTQWKKSGPAQYQFSIEGERNSIEMKVRFDLDSIDNLSPAEEEYTKYGIKPEDDFYELLFGFKNGGLMDTELPKRGTGGNEFKIFSTIREIVKDFAPKAKSRTRGLFFSANLKEGNRARLYRKFIPRMARELNGQPIMLGSADNRYEEYIILLN